MTKLKKWEYVIYSLKKIKAPKKAIYLAENIQEQLEVFDMNQNTTMWEYEGDYMVIGDKFDLNCVLYGEEYCYCCESYKNNCNLCPFNSPSIKECSKELVNLLYIVEELND